jgi:hypothetical protein
MLGWMILFALMGLTGAALGFTETQEALCFRTAGAFFSVLFLLTVLGHALRHRAR